jgi:hypothetical protein
MNEEERAFRDGLRQAVAERPGSIRVDIDEVIARASSPDFVPETRWTPPRWLAAAAAVLVVAGLGVGLAVLRPSAGIPAVPAGPVASASTDIEAADLAGTTWRATQIDGRGVQATGDGRAPGLEFTSTTEVLTSDGCNSAQRSYSLTASGPALRFSFGLAGAHTEIGCNVSQQQRFEAALDVVFGVRLSGETLEFLDPNDNVVLRLARVDQASPQPTQPPTNGVAVAIGTPSAPVTPSQTPTLTEPPSGTSNAATAVHVRLYNDTGVTVRNVKVGFLDGVVIKEAAMEPGSYGEYVSPEVAYRIASLEATADGHPYRSRPVDYVGEQPLEPGNYTFSIRLVEGVMFLEFGQD